jgi:hypothetical protein
LTLPLGGVGRQVQGEDAAGARGADVERLAVQDQVHGRHALLLLFECNNTFQSVG